MNEFGHFAACLAWLLALTAVVLGVISGRRRSDNYYFAARNATISVAICSLLALAALGYGFITSDFSNQYIWQHSNLEMDAIYKFTAIWGGMDGSMLLWAAILAVCTAIAALRSVSEPRVLAPWVIAVSNSATFFFLSVVIFFTNPFRYIQASFIPPDGNGLNPLLQNPYMAIHPPMLYLGFTTFTIPYAYCMGALLSRELTNEWIRLTRAWTLVAWGFLTVGIVLGGHWAYLELGWGGFWAWDPVENASFMPWLTGTAYLHSVMIQQRKNMLRVWNVALVVLTYGLTVFGTFLTRSGVVQSVHAFAATNVGWVFLLYLFILVMFAAILIWFRWEDLRSERKIESLFSREAAFLLNNLAFLSICFAVLWGVMFPVLSEAVTGTKQTVSIPFFNTVTVPLFLALIFLMGIGPLIAWRRASLESLRRTFLRPFSVSFLIAALLVWAGVTDFYPLLSYALCCFVTLTIIGEYYRAYSNVRLSGESAENGRVRSGVRVLKRNHHKYGGLLVHIGVVVATIGITASMAHKVEREFSLGKGETFSIGRFSLTLEDFTPARNKNYESLAALVSLRRSADSEFLATLKPEKRFYFRNKESTSEVALKMGPREDVYLALAGLDNSGQRATFKIFINPLQMWLWIGVLIMVAGTIVVLVPQRLRLRSSAPANALSFTKEP